MYEIIFRSRTFCGFLKFRPNLRKFMTFKTWKAPFEREIFWFPSFGKVDAIFVDIWRFFSWSCSHFVLFFTPNLCKVYALVISDFGQFTKVNSSWNVCHFVILESLFQRFRKVSAKVSANQSFCPSALKFLFSIYLSLTYDYPCTEMSFMPHSITNSIEIIKCGYTLILRMLEWIIQFVNWVRNLSEEFGGRWKSLMMYFQSSSPKKQ